MKNTLGTQFRNWVKHTKNKIIEIERRVWKSQFEGDDGEVHELECYVLGIKCRGDIFLKIKDMIKT